MFFVGLGSVFGGMAFGSGKSAKLGLGNQETAYIHTMLHKYPPWLAGKGVAVISAANHRQYCLDNLPQSALRDLAIKTGEDTVAFYQDLFNYIDQELTNLEKIIIKPEHVLLLLSNQVVRLCDDLHALGAFGANIRLDNLPMAVTRLAWFSLQAVTCMGTYSKARFRDHPGVNSAYLRFLTCRVAAQAELGIKGVVTSLVMKVKGLEKSMTEAATKDSVKKLDNKVEDRIKKVSKGAQPAT